MGREATQFKKGNCANPGGRPKISPELRKKAHLTKQTLINILNDLIHMDSDQLEIKLKDPKATMLELAVGRIIQKAAKEGDTLRLNFLFDRIVGKVTDIVEQTNIIKDYDPTEYEEIPREALLKLVGGE